MWGCCECMQERPLPTLETAVLSILKAGHHGRKLSKSPQRVSTHRDHLRPILGISLDFAGGEDAITLVQWCITCQNFCIKCKWTLFAWMLFLPSPVHWDIESVKEYHFDLSLLPQTSSCTGPERWGLKTSERFWMGYDGSQQMKEPAKGNFFFGVRLVSWACVHGQGSCGSLLEGRPFIMGGRWSLAASHCNLGSVAGEEGWAH